MSRRSVNRSLLLADTENLTGVVPTLATEAQITGSIRDFVATADPSPGDLLIFASNPSPSFVFAAVHEAPGSRIVTRRGENGADLALLDELANDARVAERFSTVVIGSGDGAFVEAVDRLNRLGVRTVVISRRSSLSKRLRIAAAEVRLMRNGDADDLSGAVGAPCVRTSGTDDATVA